MATPTVTVRWNTGAKDGSPTWTDAYPLPEKCIKIIGVKLDRKKMDTH